MHRNPLLWLCLLLALAGTAVARDKAAAGQPAKRPAARPSAGNQPTANEPSAKELSGMSIVGNDEAPKALFIVPWKHSEIGVETSLNRVLSESAVPVDRDVFMRQLDFYEVSVKK